MPLYGSRYVPASILAAEQEIQRAAASVEGKQAARESVCCGDPLAPDRPKIKTVGGVRVDVPNATSRRIYLKCNALADMLVAKNNAYGDDALNNPEAFGEDPVVDLAGYLILLMLAIEDEKARDNNV